MIFVWLLMLIGIPFGIPLLLAWGSARLLPYVQRLVEAQRVNQERDDALSVWREMKP